mmetsp:Transcript_63858/g.101204  ORF Transcript_63858/g.101204 Transcript_63858/m.101204 type:complete len:185 (-) Transcript_63858:291-845(-)
MATVAIPQTMSSPQLLASCFSEDAALRFKCGDVRELGSAERAELVAWNDVGRRVAAVFVNAMEEIKADSQHTVAESISHGMDASCTSAMCSPALSSVYPTDASTAAGEALSEAGTESDNENDFDFFSDCGEETLCSPRLVHRGFPCTLSSNPVESQENWHRVGQRLAAVFTSLSESEDDEGHHL